jgi:hypothetical protein
MAFLECLPLHHHGPDLCQPTVQYDPMATCPPQEPCSFRHGARLCTTPISTFRLNQTATTDTTHSTTDLFRHGVRDAPLMRPGAARLRWVSESLQRGHDHRRQPATSATRSVIAKTGAMLLNGQERASETFGRSLPRRVLATIASFRRVTKFLVSVTAPTRGERSPETSRN